MKKKHFVMALAIITVGAFISVLAQNNFAKLSGAGWFINSAQSAKNAPVSRAAANSPAPADDNYPTSGIFNDTLKNAQVSQHQDGDAVVVMNAEGDLPGVLTLKFHRDAAGTAVTSGEWAFNISYTEIKHIEPEEAGGDDYSESLVQRGTIKGTIEGGQVTLSGDGSVSAINSIQMAIDGGSLEFQATNSGSGNSQVTNLQDAATSTGNLTLSF
ncbi:MAG: hypothetical protein M3033_07725 [Acidobacteriota bacterium]|nr:hypothetical protein [Acidobacteriota bacterium]